MSKALEWRTEQRKISELVPYENNPRIISEAQKKKLQHSVETFGFVEPPVIDIDNTIVAGHQRTFAMKALGRDDEVIDVRVPNRKLTQEELDLYNVVSNVSYGEWLTEKLELLDPIKLEEFGFDPILLPTSPLEDGETRTEDKDNLAETRDKYLNGDIRQLAFIFSVEEYNNLVQKLNDIMIENDLESHSEVVMMLVNNYASTKS